MKIYHEAVLDVTEMEGTVETVIASHFDHAIAKAIVMVVVIPNTVTYEVRQMYKDSVIPFNYLSDAVDCYNNICT